MSCERKRRFGSGRPGERRTLCSSPLLIPGNFEPAPNAEYFRVAHVAVRGGKAPILSNSGAAISELVCGPRTCRHGQLLPASSDWTRGRLLMR